MVLVCPLNILIQKERDMYKENLLLRKIFVLVDT